MFVIPEIMHLAAADPAPLDIGRAVQMVVYAMGALLLWKNLSKKSPAYTDLATTEHVDKELEKVKAESRDDIGDLKEGLRELIVKLDDYAQKAYDGRKGIHVKLNDTTERVKGVEARQKRTEDELRKVEVRQDKHVEKTINYMLNQKDG